MVVMRYAITLAAMLLLVPASPCAAEDAKMSRRFVPLSFTVEGAKRTVGLHLPPGYDASKTWPLIVYLHGGGGNGDRVDATWAGRHPIVRAAREHPERFPALILVPRCPRGKIWAPVPPDPVQSPWRLRRHGRKPAPDAAAHITAAIDAAVAAYAVDEDRITLAGHSMGGEGTTRYAALHADRFAGMAPAAGSAVIVLEDAPKLARMGVCIFQGENDRISTAAPAKRLVAAIRDAGGEPRYTEYEGVGHATAHRAYSDPKVIEWLLKQERHRRPGTTA